MHARPITVAVEGCCHGELDSIYAAVEESSKAGAKVDLLLICGDFESIESESDLENIAVPPKYRHMNTFHEYVTGAKVAPVPTVFVGGNHEASNVLQSLYYGGYVAPNIYFLGFAGVVNFGFLRICGVSGIQNDAHYQLGHYERPPYDTSSLRSVYHIRELEIYRMAHLRYTASFAAPGDPPVAAAAGSGAGAERVNMFLSHDWPRHIWQYGDCQQLLRKKPGLADDIKKAQLGSAPLWDLLTQLQPHFWFCAHHHIKFAAVVPWQDAQPSVPPPGEAGTAAGEEEAPSAPEASEAAPSPPVPLCAQSGGRVTRFLSLDKVLPGRDFMQILTIPAPAGFAAAQGSNTDIDAPYALEWDVEWLAILQRTHHLLHTGRQRQGVPGTLQPMASAANLQVLRSRLQTQTGVAGLVIPSIEPREPLGGGAGEVTYHRGNAQTDTLLQALELPHVWTIPVPEMEGGTMAAAAAQVLHVDENEIDI